jgi:hypothetical protein
MMHSNLAAHLVLLCSDLIPKYGPSDSSQFGAPTLAEKNSKPGIDENVEVLNQKCDACSKVVGENRGNYGAER